MAFNRGGGGGGGRGRGGGSGGGGGQQGITADEACPKCDNDMWDNSQSKRNPNAPDYVCKDKYNCDGAVWLSDTDRNAASGRREASGAAPAPGGTSQASTHRPSLILDSAMQACLRAAKRILKEEFPGIGEKPEPIADDLVINVATTLFIARAKERAGILKSEKPKAPPKPAAPPQPPPPTEFDHGPDPDDDLPF